MNIAKKKMIKELQPQKQFTYDDVKSFLINVFEWYNLYQSKEFKERFESYLNDKWLNGNNWDNEDLEDDFFDSEIESFIY